MRTQWRIVKAEINDRGTWIPLPYVDRWMEIREWKIPFTRLWYVQRIR